MLEGLNVEEKQDVNTYSISKNEDINTEDNLKGTKLGEISDFEKSLYVSKNISVEEEKKEEENSTETQFKPESESTTTIETKSVTQTTIETESQSEVDTETEAEAETEKQEEIISVKGKDADTDYDEMKQKQEDKAEEKLVTEKIPPAETLSNDALFQQEMDKLNVDFQEGDIIKCIVRKIDKSGIYVDLGFKSEGYISNSEFSNDLNVVAGEVVKSGDEINVYILKLESKEGYTLLSRKRAEYELAWNTLIGAVKSKEIISGVRVISNVQGGLVVSFEGIKGFIPASQVLREKDQKLDQFINEILDVTVLQVDRQRRKVIFSNKFIHNKAKIADVTKLLDEIEIGQVKKGRVSSIKDFGVFVDIGGLEGLVHISELSWARVNHPSELLKIGESVNVFVLGVDKENKKISLGMKQLEPDPWVNISERYNIGQVITGIISRTVPFGAFIRIEDNLEGLIHISELSYDHIDKVEDIVSIGEKVQAKIIKLLPDDQKIGLSLKGVHVSKKETEKSSEKEPTTSDEAEKDPQIKEAASTQMEEIAPEEDKQEKKQPKKDTTKTNKEEKTEVIDTSTEESAQQETEKPEEALEKK